MNYQSQKIKIVSSFFLTLLFLLFSQFSHAQISNTKTDAEMFGINCNDTANIICLTDFTITKHVWRTYYYSCSTTTSAPDCIPVVEKTIFSQDALAALIYQYTRLVSITAANTVSPRLPGYSNCSYSGGSSPSAICTAQWEEKDANGNWYVPFNPVIPSIHPVASPTTCGAGFYIQGLGCTTANSRRAPLTGPSSCDPCRPGDSAYGYIDQNPKLAGNAINLGVGYTDVNNGSRIEARTDITFPIPFTRTYSSLLQTMGPLGLKSTHNYNKKMSVYYSDLTLNTILGLTFEMENGEQVYFGADTVANTFTPTFVDHRSYKAKQLSPTQFSLQTPSGNYEYYEVVPSEMKGKLTRIKFFRAGTYDFNYNSLGQMLGITDQYGRWLHFVYSDYANVITQISSSSGETINYTYDNGYLVKAALGLAEIEKYQYTYDINGFMTSKTDAKGVVFNLISYDTQGRVIESKETSTPSTFVNNYTFNYTPTSTSATLPDLSNASYNLTVKNYFPKTASSNIGNGLKVRNITFDANGNPKSRSSTTFSSTTNAVSSTNYEGRTTTYDWNPVHNMIQGYTESNPSFTRTVTYGFDITAPNIDLNIIQKKIYTGGAGRTWDYTYTTFGRMLTSKEPNGSITTITYYPDNHADINMRGQVYTITNGVGQTITINAYHYLGKPSQITLADGRVKNLAYDFRGRLISESVLGSNGLNNTYEYDLDGLMTKSTLANGYVLNMTYDNAHRLVGISDNRGNSMSYTLDSNGNIVNESEFAAGSLVSIKNKIFDSVSRMTKMTRESGAYPYEFTYNNDDMVTKMKSPDNLDTNYGYSYKELTSVLKNGVGETYTKDNDGNITAVSQSGNTTSFTYNGFGDMLTQTNPDSGYHQYTNDIDGKRKIETDASGTVLTTTYDNIGRVLTTPSPFTLPNTDPVYTWDTLKPGKLTSVVVPGMNVSVNYTYDNQSRVISKNNSMAPFFNKTVNYAYDAAGQMNIITYPSGAQIEYVYDKGAITDLKINSTTLLNQITYKGFSPQPVGWTWVGGQSRNTTINPSGMLTALSDSTLMNQTITQDTMGKITALTDSATPANSFSTTYNTTTLTELATLSKPALSENWNYNSAGRFNLSSIQSSTPGVAYKNFYFNGNKIQQLSKSNVWPALTGYPSYDPKGNMLTDGLGNSYTYDPLNNLNRHVNAASNWSTGYVMNGLGQRIWKSGFNMTTFASTSTFYMYDEKGLLIGEYDGSGNTIAEHVYLGRTPVAVIKGGVVYKVHTDYLGTPRVIADLSGNLKWKWENRDAYGGNLANDNLSGTVFEYNIRFPGQYFDKESGLHYNNRRTYNPELGRYLQPDPIGVAGGMNTYAYVENDPINASDPSGLVKVFLADKKQDPIMYAAYLNDQDNSNRIIVYGHGTERGLQFNRYGNKFSGNPNYEEFFEPGTTAQLSFDVKNLINLLQNRAGINIADFESIELRVCNVGDEGIEGIYAQELANATNKPVWATDHYYVFSQDSANNVEPHSVGPKYAQPIGKWALTVPNWVPFFGGVQPMILFNPEN